MSRMEKRYGLMTTACLIIGAVIGSGIFFLNETVFAATGGMLWMAAAAWLLGGAIMFVMLWVWGQLAKEKEGMAGLMDYADKLIGPRYAYFLTWFLGTILYPGFGAILAWVSARFTAQLLGWEQIFTSGPVWMLAGCYLVFMYVMNVLSPKLAGHFQVSTTFIKVIPLILMGIVGITFGIFTGNYETNLQFGSLLAESDLRNPFYVAVLATIFAYAGSEEVLMMKSEIKDSKRTLPRAIIIAGIVIILIYVGYTVGVFGAAPIESLATSGGILAAFNGVFGQFMGRMLFVFIIISCLGAMNSGMMAGMRSFYMCAYKGMGPNPEAVKVVDPGTDMPASSSAMYLLFTGITLFIIFANAQEIAPYGAQWASHYRWFSQWFGPGVTVGLTALAPITLMTFYIPIFVKVILREFTWNFFNRFVAPIASICGALLLIYMTFHSNPIGSTIYLIYFMIIMGIGAFFLVRNKK